MRSDAVGVMLVLVVVLDFGGMVRWTAGGCWCWSLVLALFSRSADGRVGGAVDDLGQHRRVSWSCSGLLTIMLGRRQRVR